MPETEYLQHTITSAQEKLHIVQRYEEVGFRLEKVRPTTKQAEETLVFSKTFNPNEATCSDLPIGGIKFSVNWPYNTQFKAFAAAQGLDLNIGPNDDAHGVTFREYMAEITRAEAESFLVQWGKNRMKLSKEAELIVRPFGRLQGGT
jgi:hypothetical protein